MSGGMDEGDNKVYREGRGNTTKKKKAPVRTQPDGFVFKAMVERDLREK